MNKGVSGLAFADQKTYTTKDIYQLPEGQRGELIDGQLYMIKAVHKPQTDDSRSGSGNR